MFRFLLFDADHTLLDFDADLKRAVRRAYTAMGLDAHLPYSDEVLALYERCNKRWWERFERGLCDKQTLYTERFHDFFREAGLPDTDPKKMNEIYFEMLGLHGTPFPGALELLRSLSKSFPIYIITNGHVVSQKTRFKDSGILDYVTLCFISDEIGFAKPDKRFFDFVLQSIPGANKENCVVIGDSLSADMLGAANAGLPSVWYNPARKPNTLSVPVTFEAASYTEVFRILTQTEKDTAV